VGLSLAWNGLGERGGIAMGEALACCPALMSLDLRHNNLERAAAHSLADGIENASSLTSLDLSYNPLGRLGVKALLRALEGSAALIDLGLACVDGLDDADAHLQPFDRKSPVGTYVLNLSSTWERWIASQLRDLALTDPGASWKWATHEAGTVEPNVLGFSHVPGLEPPLAVHLNEAWTLPRSGILRLEFAHTSPKPTSIVHYTLDLSWPRDREIARQLWIRALAEPGENWLNEQIDGRIFGLQEGGSQWKLPEQGILQLDYATFQLKYEENYTLDLAKPPHRALLAKMLERAAAEPAENFIFETLDGAPYQLPDDEVRVRRWKMPEQGILTFSFLCNNPQHVSTRHFSLDMSVQGEWLLGERLREWAIEMPGDNWANVTLDGDPVEFNQNAAPGEPILIIRQKVVSRQVKITPDNRSVRPFEKRQNLPSKGTISFDFVILKPRAPVDVSGAGRVVSGRRQAGSQQTGTQPRLDLAKPADKQLAETLRAMGVDLLGDGWITEPAGGARNTAQEADPGWNLPGALLALAPGADEQLRALSARELCAVLEMLRRRKGLVDELQLEMLSRETNEYSLTSAQVLHIVNELDSPWLRFKVSLLLVGKVTNLGGLGEVAAAVADGGDLLKEWHSLQRQGHGAYGAKSSEEADRGGQSAAGITISEWVANAAPAAAAAASAEAEADGAGEEHDN